MLKWKKYKFDTISNNTESLTDILAGMSGKGRVIKLITSDIDDDIYIRVYRDAEQFVDFECNLITATFPLLPMDLPLVEGQLCKAGFYNESAGDVTPTIAIGYEETG